jgi:imidazolonepropionase-like amidohydrolase
VNTVCSVSNMKFSALIYLLASFSQPVLSCMQHHGFESNLHPQLERRTKPGIPNRKTLLKNVRIFDGLWVTEPTTLFLDGEFISEPFPVSNSSDIRTIDGGNRVIIPGLIDAHLHVQDVAGLEELTRYGVTTGLNMGCANYTLCKYLRSYSQSDIGLGIASFFFAGQAAVGSGATRGPVFASQPGEPVYPYTNATERVEYAYRNGSNYYKLISEPNGLSDAMQAALVQATHGFGMQAMTHAADIKAYEQAIVSMTDVIQHIPADGLLSDMALEAMQRNNQWATPTINIFKIAFQNPLIIQVLLGKQITSESYENVVDNVSRLRQAGIPVLAGSDATGLIGAAGMNMTIPFGLTLHWELENLVEAGYSPAEAIQSATILIAKKHRLCDRGVIKPGKRADLVLLDANPLLNISNTQKIAGVWVGGVPYGGIDTLK